MDSFVVLSDAGAINAIKPVGEPVIEVSVGSGVAVKVAVAVGSSVGVSGISVGIGVSVVVGTGSVFSMGAAGSLHAVNTNANNILVNKISLAFNFIFNSFLLKLFLVSP